MRSLVVTIRFLTVLTFIASWLTLPACAGPSTTVTGSVTINSGGLDISSNGTAIAFGAVTLQGVDQQVSATSAPTFTIFDGTGTGNGWNVTFSATNFTDGGTGSIANTNFTFQPSGGSVALVAGTGGQAVDATNGPKETGGSAVDLSSARKVLTAAASFGKGKYTFAPLASQFKLTIPATTVRGTGSLSSTLTVSINSGP